VGAMSGAISRAGNPPEIFARLGRRRCRFGASARDMAAPAPHQLYHTPERIVPASTFE
jgi:hypothetical protein